MYENRPKSALPLDQKPGCRGSVSIWRGAHSLADFPLLGDRDFSTAFFNSIPLSGSLAGPMLSSHSGPPLLPLDPGTPIPFSSSKPSTEPAAGTRPLGDAASKDG